MADFQWLPIEIRFKVTRNDRISICENQQIDADQFQSISGWLLKTSCSLADIFPVIPGDFKSIPDQFRTIPGGPDVTPINFLSDQKYPRSIIAAINYHPDQKYPRS